MQRRYLPLLSAIVTAFAVSLHISAAEKKSDGGLDDFGCHLDEITDSYFCSSGPLEGREFLTKSELDDAVEAWKAKEKAKSAERPNEALPPPAPPTPAILKVDDAKKAANNNEDANLKVMSWNMKSLAGEESDYDRAAMVLGKADVIALQEVDLKGQGKGFLNVIGNMIQAKTQSKICRAWVQSGSGERQTYGFLWKESTVSLVEDGGGMKDTCGETATTIRQSKKMKAASIAMFYFKPQKKMFVLGTVFLDKKPAKAADKSMTDLFKSIDDAKFPVVLAGDLKMGAGNPAFSGARKLGFHSAMSGSGKGWDNVWYRGATLKQGAPVDLYLEFADVRREDIQRDFSGIFPVMAEFSFKEENVTDSVNMVTKPAKKKKANGSERARKSKSL